MLKYHTWVCDICGKEEQFDGFPRHWIKVEIGKGDYFHDDDAKNEVDKQCCSQSCANKAVLDYYSEHRLEG